MKTAEGSSGDQYRIKSKDRRLAHLSFCLLINLNYYSHFYYTLCSQQLKSEPFKQLKSDPPKKEDSSSF